MKNTSSAIPTLEYTTTLPSPVGVLTIASDGAHITGLWIEGQKYFAATLSENAIALSRRETLPVFEQTFQWLERYFNGERPEMTIPLNPAGSEFRKDVWKILCEIPYGEVITYGQIANMMAQKMGRSSMSAQAVGGAVGHNPISILIPCHRVVGADGSMTGYAGGIENKLRLLKLEKLANISEPHYT